MGKNGAESAKNSFRQRNTAQSPITASLGFITHATPVPGSCNGRPTSEENSGMKARGGTTVTV